ncbi:MAG: Pectate lyase superfamily protein [candidate division BRC1 bacterium ADurb.BinA364]|nr:MAG: Pectate lyase superfamily protein [candidate division BRC1 bacterium ADurb.BinA364]
MNTEQFIYPTIFEPVYHGLDLTVPPDLGNQTLARLGYVDVTAAPFHADPTGKRDATQVLQAAVNFARDRQMVCFLPAGDYRVSDTIDCVRNYYRWRADRIAGARHHPCMLVGSVKDPRRRARIVLASHSPGFTDPNRPKRIVKFWARASSPRVKGNWSDLAQKPGVEQANICFNQMIVSIDISIGEGNPGAVGICLRGAQGSGAQDVAIDARHGHTGLEGGVGSGGAHLGITVIGGRIGMDLTEAQPAPTIGGITLIGQTEAALRYSGWGGLAAARLDIRPAAGAVAIQGGAVGADDPFRGHLSVVDCTIDCERWNTAVPAIETCKSLCLENVFVRNAATAVRFDGEPLAPGRPNVWTRIASFARPPRRDATMRINRSNMPSRFMRMERS